MFPQLDLLIEKIVAVAAGDQAQHPQAEALLQRMTQQGWNLAPAVQRLWAGERDPAVLVDGLDDQERAILLDALEMLTVPGSAANATRITLPDNLLQALAGLPEPLQTDLHAALQAQDALALQDAYQAAQGQLTPTQEAQLHAALADWASQDGPQPTRQQRRELLDELPEPLRLAVLEQDPDALQRGLFGLPPEQAGAWLERLVQAGFFAEAEQDRFVQTVADLEPVLQAIAKLAANVAANPAPEDAAVRAQMDEFLQYLEGHGLRLRPAIAAFWGGQRDPAALCAGLDEQEQWIVLRLLSLV